VLLYHIFGSILTTYLLALNTPPPYFRQWKLWVAVVMELKESSPLFFLTVSPFLGKIKIVV